jgi:tetratricopeptide (TPR) repeat protein
MSTKNNRGHISQAGTSSVLVVAVVVALVLVVGYCLTALQAHQEPPVPIESHDYGSQMTSYVKQGRFDEAVQVGLQALQNDPNDEAVYQEIAMVYFIRAQKDGGHRDEWVSKAISYTEKSLLLNSKDRDVAGVHLLQDARSFESAGDLSSDKSCAYYDKARKLLEDRASRLQGEQVTVAGKTFPLEPLRKENDRVLGGVKDKAAKARCK